MRSTVVFHKVGERSKEMLKALHQATLKINLSKESEKKLQHLCSLNVTSLFKASRQKNIINPKHCVGLEQGCPTGRSSTGYQSITRLIERKNVYLTF